MFSRLMNLVQAFLKERGVLSSPMPMTRIPDSRRRLASRVKSESLDTMQNPSTIPPYRMSIASMIRAESVAFFPVTLANC